MDHGPALQQVKGSLSSAGSGRRRTPFDTYGDPRPGPRDCDIRLTLPARAENVALVRHVIGALAEALRFPPVLVEDVKLAVTEACTNVVRHAYGGSDGPIDISLVPTADVLTVVVCDEGPGIRPNPAEDGPGLGLPLMAALSNKLEIDHGHDRGSRVSMSFRVGGGTLETA